MQQQSLDVNFYLNYHSTNAISAIKNIITHLAVNGKLRFFDNHDENWMVGYAQ